MQFLSSLVLSCLLQVFQAPQTFHQLKFHHIFSRKVNQKIFPHFLVVDFLPPKIGVGNFFRSPSAEAQATCCCGKAFPSLETSWGRVCCLDRLLQGPGFFWPLGKKQQREVEPPHRFGESYRLGGSSDFSCESWENERIFGRKECWREILKRTWVDYWNL